MFKIDDDEIKQFEADLGVFSKTAIPHATRNTLNNAGFKTQKLARHNVGVKMIQRNKFTKQSIQVDQARSLTIQRQETVVGSIADYMEDQEFGETKVKRGSEGIPIATSYSAGQNMKSQVRTRLPRKPNRLQNIQLKNRKGKAKGRKQKNIVAIRNASITGSKYVFLDFGRKKGIFRVIGGKRRAKIRMVWDLSETSITIPKNPWLKPSFDAVVVLIPEIYKDSLTFQAKRLQLFR